MPSETCVDVTVTIMDEDPRVIEEIVEKIRRIFIEEKSAVQFETTLIGMGDDEPITCGPVHRKKGAE